MGQVNGYTQEGTYRSTGERGSVTIHALERGSVTIHALERGSITIQIRSLTSMTSHMSSGKGRKNLVYVVAIRAHELLSDRRLGMCRQ